MKKISLGLLLILIVLAVSACAKAQIVYTLSDENATAVRYALAFEDADQDVAPYLTEIGSYWAQEDMAIYVDKEQSTVTGEKTAEYATVREAAQGFATLLTSGDSPLSHVTFSYTPSLEKDDYSLTADVSLQDVMRQNEAQSIPPEQVAELEEAARQGVYLISVAMPGDAVETNADSDDGGLYTWRLEYGKTTKIMLHTQKENKQAVQSYNKLVGIMDDNNMLIMLCAIAAGFCVLMIVLSTVVRRMLSKRRSEIRVKPFR